MGRCLCCRPQRLRAVTLPLRTVVDVEEVDVDAANSIARVAAKLLRQLRAGLEDGGFSDSLHPVRGVTSAAPSHAGAGAYDSLTLDTQLEDDARVARRDDHSPTSDLEFLPGVEVNKRSVIHTPSPGAGDKQRRPSLPSALVPHVPSQNVGGERAAYVYDALDVAEVAVELLHFPFKRVMAFKAAVNTFASHGHVDDAEHGTWACSLVQTTRSRVVVTHVSV